MAAMVNASAAPRFGTAAHKLKFSFLPSRFTFSSYPLPKFQTIGQNNNIPQAMSPTNFPILIKGLKNGMVCSAIENGNELIDADKIEELEFDEDKDNHQLSLNTDTRLYSVSPFPLLLLAALLPGASTVRSLFGPFVELVQSWSLPDWLVHWGHPGNMAVVLFAMGGYGTYLGFRIRSSDDLEEKVKAKDLHPKLMAGMFFFFALGATGGVTSLLTSEKPIFESPHAVTGVVGLALLTLQTILPALFEGNPGLRNVHGILGSGIMTLFLVHAALGLQLGLSY